MYFYGERENSVRSTFYPWGYICINVFYTQRLIVWTSGRITLQYIYLEKLNCKFEQSENDCSML